MLIVRRTRSIICTTLQSIKIDCETARPISLTDRFTVGSFSTKFEIVKQILRLPTPICVKSAFWFKLCRHVEISFMILFDVRLSATPVSPDSKCCLIEKKGESGWLFSRFYKKKIASNLVETRLSSLSSGPVR